MNLIFSALLFILAVVTVCTNKIICGIKQGVVCSLKSAEALHCLSNMHSKFNSKYKVISPDSLCCYFSSPQYELVKHAKWSIRTKAKI